MHRDIKTENILFCKNKKFVKLIDFGFSKFCHRPQLTEKKGTPYYMSPEVIRGNYDKRCDLWSVGVLTYKLLCGQYPFQGDEIKDLDEKICAGGFVFNEEYGWDRISTKAKDFIKGLIEPDLNRRMTCEQALKHTWLSDNVSFI